MAAFFMPFCYNRIVVVYVPPKNTNSLFVMCIFVAKDCFRITLYKV
jgi:hypothetical protein